jgi:polysaccharide biosynthesis protein PslG
VNGRPRWRWAVAGALAVGVVAVVALVLLGGRGSTVTSSTSSPAVAVPSAVTPARPAPAGEAFGVNVNRLFNDRTYTRPQIDAQLQALRATGVTVARSDALWEASEPTAPVDGVHHYDWAFDDVIAGSLAAHGLTWLPILDYSAPWAQSIAGQDHSPPRSDPDYAAYAQAFAARYGSGGSFWRAHPELPATPAQTLEIWNEPDNGEFWAGGPDAARYADLYLAARGAIDAVDPSARVIVGGLAHPTVFLPAMMLARPQLKGAIDGVAIHPYGTPPVLLAKLRASRATLVSLGMATVPLYVTEFGWTTDPPGALDYVAPAQRAVYITRTLSALGHLDCGVAATVLYTWVSPERDPSDSGDWYGIHGPAGPGGAGRGGAAGGDDTAAFTAGLRGAAGPGATIPLCAG